MLATNLNFKLTMMGNYVIRIKKLIKISGTIIHFVAKINAWLRHLVVALFDHMHNVFCDFGFLPITKRLRDVVTFRCDIEILRMRSLQAVEKY